MKTSKTVAKSILRVFFIVLCMGLASYFLGFGAFSKHPEQHDTYFGIRNGWTLVYPGLLLAGFITLLIICLKNKYSRPDTNWLLVLNTAILMTYCIVFYLKLYQILNPGG
jgi:hypothetical protein